MPILRRSVVQFCSAPLVRFHTALDTLSLLTFVASLIYLILKVKGPVTTSRSRIDDLVRRNRSELDETFLAGETPTIEEMEGIVDGNVMAGVLLLNNQYFRNFLNLGWFIWRGKVFENVTSIDGKGINRFKMGPFKFLRYQCEIRIVPPLVGTDNVDSLVKSLCRSN